jgi:hypothetical protein
MVPAARPPNSPAATSPPPARTGVVAALPSANTTAIKVNRFIASPEARIVPNANLRLIS